MLTNLLALQWPTTRTVPVGQWAYYTHRTSGPVGLAGLPLDYGWTATRRTLGYATCALLRFQAELSVDNDRATIGPPHRYPGMSLESLDCDLTTTGATTELVQALLRPAVLSLGHRWGYHSFYHSFYHSVLAKYYVLRKHDLKCDNH